VLNIAAQLMFPESQVPLDPWFVKCLYINSAVTITGIVGFIVWFAFSVAAEAEERSERLLRNILPESIASRLKSNPDELIADRFDEASVLFADLVGFTKLSNELSPEKMIGLLNEIFSSFDKISLQLGTEKIKTIGDAYMVVAGIPDPTELHAHRLVALAIGMQESIQQISDSSNGRLQLRIGIATGPITAGVIGKAKFAYDVWAPTVNLAARLESYGEPRKIHVSDATKRALESDYEFEQAPTKDIKGIGRIRTWYLISAVDSNQKEDRD
jgi:adenylate cyclase